jgi:hypothetical protein
VTKALSGWALTIPYPLTRTMRADGSAAADEHTRRAVMYSPIHPDLRIDMQLTSETLLPGE